MEVTCATILGFLGSPWTYAGLAGGLTVLGLGYRYSRFTFLTRLTVLLRLSSLFNFVLNSVKTVIKLNGLRFLALYTTFSQTIRATVNGKPLAEIITVLGNELWNKIVLSAKNIVDGLGLLVKWLNGSSTTCGYYQSSEILVSAVMLIWTGVAAYIFVVWIWKMMWYDWRNVEMEQQQWILLIGVVTSLSLAVYGTGLVTDLVSTGTSLVNTTAQTLPEGVGNTTSNISNSTG